jgi:hypothetical protein
MYDTEGPCQVFLWYRLGNYQENTNQYHTEIPNWDTTLLNLYDTYFVGKSGRLNKTMFFFYVGIKIGRQIQNPSDAFSTAK